MTVMAEFHFDFGSPNAYLSHRVIPEIEQRTGASFRYVPVLLGGGVPLLPGPPGPRRLALTGHTIDAKSGIALLEYRVVPG